MEYGNIGENIATLRREHGAKQEELARAVGVSAQAVSKWECGGTPDAELIPVIADFFRVPTDRLYGRSVSDYSEINTALVKQYAHTIPHRERLRAAWRYNLIIQRGLFFDDIRDMDEQPEHYNCDHSQVITDDGMLLISLSEKLPYSFVMPEPEHGLRAGLESIDAYQKLFAALGNRDVLETLFLLNSRLPRPFTRKYFENITGIESERASEVLQTLINYEFMETAEMDIDDEVRTLYTFKPNPAFAAVLALCTEIISRPNSFYGYMGNAEGCLFKER